MACHLLKWLSVCNSKLIRLAKFRNAFIILMLVDAGIKYIVDNCKAQIVQAPENAAVLEGEDALFFCGVEGNPEPTINFRLDGHPGRMSGEIGRVIPVPGKGGSFLRLFKVSSKRNGTKVECYASNHVGSDKSSAQLQVYKYTDSVPVGFPKFVRSPKSQAVDVGKTVHLECEAEGAPELKFLWLKNEIPVHFQQKVQSFDYSTKNNHDGSVEESSIAHYPLYFENVNSSDDAHYECVVSNKYGSIMSSKIHLAVKDTFYPPTIIEQQEKVEVRPGQGANLSCTANGNPRPQVKWLTDQEKPLTEAVEWKAILFLTDVTEPRVYICVANNSLGRIQHLVRVEIIDVPRAPADLQCLERGPTYASLRWFSSRSGDRTQPDSLRSLHVPITSYTLIVTDLDADNRHQAVKRKLTDISPWKVQPDGSVQLKVTDLKPDHRYTAEVYALSTKFGISDASNKITFKTLEMPPSGPPLSIYATATSPDSISISWKPPAEANGKLLGYRVYYSTQLRNKLDQWQTLQTTKPHAVLQGLVEMATYYLKVNAFNSAGDGPLSEAFPVIVNPGVPSQPLNFRGVSSTPTSIQLIWSPPESPHGMTILDYQLQCRSVSEIGVTNLPQTPLTISISAKQTGWTIKMLQPDTLYQVSLSARTHHGVGVPAKLEIRTLSNLPSPPQDLTLDNFQKETALTGGGFPRDYIVLKLKWNPPAETHGELKGYQVSFRLVGPPELLMITKPAEGKAGKLSDGAQITPTHAVRRNVTGTSYTSTQIDNIQFGRIYQFEVAAYNSIDIGVPAHLNITTPENVEISWSPPPKESRNGIIIGYQVHYYEFGSPQNTANYQNTTQTFLRIDDLQERTVYTFRVRAFTSSGPGPWSASNTLRTTADLPDPPTHIKAERINQRQIKVTWSLPRRSTHHISSDLQQRSTPVTGFRICYAAHDSVVDPSRKRILEVGAVTMATLDDVSPTESYNIKIQSRGTDKRFGNWSDPVMVGESQDSVYHPRRVADLRCFGVKPLEFTNPAEASVKVTWLPPPDQRVLKEYEIQISGIKSFTNELNDPVRLTLGPKKLTVRFTKQSAFGEHLGLQNDFRLRDQDSLLVHTINKLEPNAVFDIEVRPVYETLNDRQRGEAETLWERTSCRTRMHPPANITAPVPVAFKADTNEVLVRLQRVSENLGPIRRYYLIISSLERAGVLISTDHIDWHSELLRIAPGVNKAETRVAAEFTQLAFDSTQLEIQVGGREEFTRNRRSVAWKVSPEVGRASSKILDDDSSQYHSDILLYDCRLSRGKRYKAILLACIYSDVQYAVPLHKRPNLSYYNGNQAGSKIITDSVDKGDEYEDSINPNYCSSSGWSATFTPEESLIVTKANGISNLAGSGDESSTNGVINRTGPSFFTIILVTVIIGLALVALVCIAVQCFFRRRSKQQRNSIGAKLPKTDNSLKVPLMPPSHHKSLVPGIDPAEMHPGEIQGRNDYVTDSSSPVNSSHSPGVRASPPPQTSEVLEHGPPIQALSAPGTPLQRTPQFMLGQTLPNQSPISLNHLAVHVANLKSFDNNGLYREYEAIDSGSGFTWQHANMELNKAKNRYANVIAYDHSRVILSQLPGVPCSDYINANYLDGYQRPNAYIATQGPLPETFGDFWRMVWEQNSRVIVMMTKLEERSRLKCDQYWPSRGTEIYQICLENELRSPSIDFAAFAVTLLDATDYAYYTIRTFSLQKMAQTSATDKTTSQNPHNNYTDDTVNLQPLSELRQIKHFQFTAWPDCGAPEQPQPLLLFIRQVSQARNALKKQVHRGQKDGIPPNLVANSASVRLGPTVVHCSAGVGRTGAFIVIDSQLDRIRSENTVDIFGAVSRMRAQRNFMVQTEQQYAFLYEVMVEAVQLTGSEVTAHNLYNYVMKLRQTAPTSMLSMYLEDHANRGALKVNFPTSMSTLELEFQRVSINLQVSSQCTSALLPENRNKNRLDSVLPYEYNRVVLSTVRGVEGADYINASFVDGYWHERAYIATQAPLASTTKDFWRMVWEHNSPIIVMLSQTVENGKEQCFQYWPSERSQRYEQFLVEPMVEYNMPSFVLREFCVTNIQEGQSRTLRQFQFSDWPDNGVAISRASETLIELISQVHKTQVQFGQDGPITVHCSTGAGRTGIFVALSILLERMRCEGMVDLLLTTRLLRSQRSHMIEDESQYAFCYTALLEFLAAF
ncbi:receptor type tyrosine protein phosphatase [Echinococcus multilocularis]|uniref:protein-tyrosine-phosphatase n=1 Tax=Echinococcus multilocularis TaxID=6211 RepID=A0A087VX41_ECHMU|nr:receptor type tyrosine protein phosphatase [Echinococcus multilocularis]